MAQVDTGHARERVHERPGATALRGDIEGLRAVAVIAVVLFHADVPGITGGFVGVDVFFVISGFLITGMLWREVTAAGTIRMGRFYGARARRLLPASATVGVVTMIAAALILPPLQARSVMSDGIASALYVSNYWFVMRGVNYFAEHMPPSPFQHYWSLGVEEQFYLIWPPLIIAVAFVIRRFRRHRSAATHPSTRPYIVILAIIAATSFLLSFVGTYVVTPAAFFSLPTRAWQLAAGGLVALTIDRWRTMPRQAAAITGWAGLLAIGLACTELSANTVYPGIAALLPTIGPVLLIGAGCAATDTSCGRLLSTPSMRWIGRVSYSWYLWHWPVLVLTPVALGHPVSLPGRFALVLASLGIAVLTLRLIENPLRFAGPIRRSASASIGLGAVATTIAVVTGMALLHAIPAPVGRGSAAPTLRFDSPPTPPGFPPATYDDAVRQIFSQVHNAVAASVGLDDVPDNLIPTLGAAATEKNTMLFGGCLRTPFEQGQPPCSMGDTTSSTTVTLLGDSHAAMWQPAFEQLALDRQWRLELLAKGACPVLDLPVGNVLHRLVERIEHCGQWRTEIKARLRAERPRLVVVSLWRGYGTDESLSGYRAFDESWIRAMAALVEDIRHNGSTVLVLGPVPDPHFVVPICLSGYLNSAHNCELDRHAAVRERGIVTEDKATLRSGGHYADLTDLFCASDRCPVIVGNTLVYIDEDHLTLEYARALAPAIGALADRALNGG